MNLFSRTRALNPEHAQEGLSFSVEIAEQVSGVTGLEVIPWASVYGAPVGTVSFSARVESLAAMGAAQEKLAADTKYQERISKQIGRLFTGPAEDIVLQFLGFAGSGGNAGRYASLVSAQCAPGKIGEAMSWGVEIMNHVSELTGRDMAMVRGLYGPWATLGWISLADTLEQVDAAEAAMSSDATYLKRIDQGAELFVTASASQRLVRRLG